MDIVITNCIKMLQARKYTNIVENVEENNTITANDSSGKNVMVIILNKDRLNISSVKDTPDLYSYCRQREFFLNRYYIRYRTTF